MGDLLYVTLRWSGGKNIKVHLQKIKWERQIGLWKGTHVGEGSAADAKLQLIF